MGQPGGRRRAGVQVKGIWMYGCIRVGRLVTGDGWWMKIESLTWGDP